jgi:hypothetical protein
LSEEGNILDQVRDFLGEDDEVPTDNFEIKAKLVEWGGGDNFPDEHSQARSYLTDYLANLFREHGIASVLIAVEELEAELEAMELELPDYYRRDRFNSKLNQALKIARRNEARWAKEWEERRQRG